jgi:Flp pilus assembly protein TadD
MIAAAFILLFAANVDELYKRGVEAFERGQAAEAVQVLNQAAELAPDNAQVWKALGVVYASRGDFERAADPFSKACALASQLRDACYFHARNLYALNRFEPSLAVLRKALPYDHSPWRIHLGIAQALEALARPQEAEKEFRIAIESGGARLW